MGMGELESRMRKEAVERERNCSEREIGEEAEWKTIQGAACGCPIEMRRFFVVLKRVTERRPLRYKAVA